MKRTVKVEFPGRSQKIITSVTVQQAMPTNSPGQGGRVALNSRAMWDTGAGITLISKSLAQKLGLISFDTSRITGISGSMVSNIYRISLTLPCRSTFSRQRAAEWDGHRDYDMLLGMDIISWGDFRLRLVNGKTIMTFILPKANMP